MLQPGSGYVGAVEALGFPAWAADNGCFAQGAAFRLDRFYAWLERVPRSRLLWVTAPDVFPDAVATLTRSLPVLRELRRLGLGAAFVAQDGSEGDGMIPWDDADAIFIGGRDPWKIGGPARAVITEGKRRGKWIHMGRVNSARRLRYATTIGCDSADGTFLRFRNRGGDGSRDLISWCAQHTWNFQETP